MDAATLQDRVYAGYDKAAQRVGYVFDIYRSATAMNPLAIGNKLGSLNATFTPGKTGANYKAASDQKSSLWTGLFDGRQTQPGDYLVNADHGIFFISAQQDILPILCMQCAHTISVFRSAGQSGEGALGYGGATEAADTILGQTIPAAIIFRREGQKGAVGLPADASRPTWDVFIPRLTMAGGTTVTDRDFIEDELGRRYLVLADYVDDQGYYLRVERVEA